MNFNNQRVAAYKETQIKTASQGSLIIMLYDECIKQITIAIELMDSGSVAAQNIEKIHAAILKAQKIITELMISLNLEEGGEIAQNLFSIYSYFNQQLLHANINKQPAVLSSIKEMMDELRSVWSQVANSSVAGSLTQKQGLQNGVNIAR